MRKYDIPNPYEKLKDFTRGKATVSRTEYLQFIEGLEGLPVEEKKNMMELTPQKYIGCASILAKSL
jgi:adenylosuccinate lyase